MQAYRVNPKHVHSFAEVFDGTPGLHDAKAAGIAAGLHLSGRSRLWSDPPAEQKDLRGLAEELEVHQSLHRANLNRLEALTARHWPELGEAAELSGKIGGTFLEEAERRAITDSARDSPGVPCTPGERAHIKTLTQDLLRTHRMCMKAGKRMTREETVETVKVCSTTVCAAIAALLGDLRKYPNTQSLPKAAGTNLKERSSGKHKGQLKIGRERCGITSTGRRCA